MGIAEDVVEVIYAAPDIFINTATHVGKMDNRQFTNLALILLAIIVAAITIGYWLMF